MQKTGGRVERETRMMWTLCRNLLVLILMVHVEMMLASAGWAQSSSSTVSLDPEVVEEKPTVFPPVPKGPVPFARQERALRNSERWKEMTPEEQEQALAKIYKYRKLFQQRQVERLNKYSPYIVDKPKKKKSLSSRRRPIAERQFEDIWGKWQALAPKTQSKLAKQWKIEESLPSQRRREFLKFWNSLLPGEKQRFRFELQYQ